MTRLRSATMGMSKQAKQAKAPVVTAMGMNGSSSPEEGGGPLVVPVELVVSPEVSVVGPVVADTVEVVPVEAVVSV